MQTIRKRLLHIEDEFISSLANNPSSDFTFFESKIRDDIQRAILSDHTNDAILELANTIITRSALLVHRLSFLDQKGQELTDSLHNEVEEIFNPQGPSPTKFHSKSTTPIGSSLPPYIAPAYHWLMENLHCPYPSVAKKDSLAKLSGTGRKAIDAWFIDIRKRIGWSSLRKLRYHGKKKEIIRDATEFFQENKHVDASLEFASIHGAAKELYSGKLGHSVLATHIGELIDRKRGSSSTPRSSATSEGSSPSSDDRYNTPPRLALITKSSLSKRSRSKEGREESEHNSRSLKRQRVYPGPKHPPVVHCNTACPPTFDPNTCPLMSSPADPTPLVESEEHVDSGSGDSVIVPFAEASSITTPCISPSASWKRLAPGSDFRPLNDSQNKASNPPSVPDSLAAQNLETQIQWNVNPELPHLITPPPYGFGNFAAYDVEAFDFGSFNYGDPLQMSQIVGADPLEAIPSFLSPMTNNPLDISHNQSTQAPVGVSDFPLSDLSSISPFDLNTSSLSATLDGFTQPPELNTSTHKSGSPLETDQTASWNFGTMDSFFSGVTQTPPLNSIVTQSSVFREERRKKMQQLAEMRLAQRQLEAEIATLDSQYS